MKRPQLTLRDLLWLVLVAAIALGLWRERQENAALLVRLSDVSNRQLMLQAQYDSLMRERIEWEQNTESSLRRMVGLEATRTP
jgi:hypothetical protein